MASSHLHGQKADGLEGGILVDVKIHQLVLNANEGAVIFFPWHYYGAINLMLISQEREPGAVAELTNVEVVIPHYQSHLLLDILFASN